MLYVIYVCASRDTQSSFTFLNTEMAVLHTLPFNLVSFLYKFSFFSLYIYYFQPPAKVENCFEWLKEHVFAGAH